MFLKKLSIEYFVKSFKCRWIQWRKLLLPNSILVDNGQFPSWHPRRRRGRRRRERKGSERRMRIARCCFTRLHILINILLTRQQVNELEILPVMFYTEYRSLSLFYRVREIQSQFNEDYFFLSFFMDPSFFLNNEGEKELFLIDLIIYYIYNFRNTTLSLTWYRCYTIYTTMYSIHQNLATV